MDLKRFECLSRAVSSGITRCTLASAFGLGALGLHRVRGILRGNWRYSLRRAERM